MTRMIVALIGAGTIGRAVIESLLSSGFKGRIIATRRRIEKIMDLVERGVEVTRNNKEAAKRAQVIIICVKPNDVKKVLSEIRDEIENKLVISLA
ncbi:pyrroline-5-carboxylate reductase, partial [Candidatus Geothermarchaeota archaeon]